MRTSIEIDDNLVNEAMLLSHAKTKKKVLEMALQELIRGFKMQELAKLYGKIEWEGDLSEMRQGRFLENDTH